MRSSLPNSALNSGNSGIQDKFLENCTKAFAAALERELEDLAFRGIKNIRISEHHEGSSRMVVIYGPYIHVDLGYQEYWPLIEITGDLSMDGSVMTYEMGRRVVS